MNERVAFLKALTPDAQVCLGRPQLELQHFPFRVGRESRTHEAPRFSGRRRPDSVPNNDLYLFELGLCNVSREHFQIERRNDEFYIVDRGSTCGTIVEGTVIGRGRAGGEKRLENGDVIIVGTSGSKHVFKFVATTELTDAIND